MRSLSGLSLPSLLAYMHLYRQHVLSTCLWIAVRLPARLVPQAVVEHWCMGCNFWEPCRWILEADVEAALEMFLELQPPLPPSTVLPLLAGQVGAAIYGLTCNTCPNLAIWCYHKLHCCHWQAGQSLDMYGLTLSP